MKIAVLGGSFNPPHCGHLLIAKQILDFCPVDEIWLTPCYKHTFQKTLAATKHREAMTKMLTRPRIKYCGLEIKHKLTGDTIELMNLLKKKYPQHQFSFIIGSDNLCGFKKWGNWKKLITSFDFWVFPRPHFQYDLKKYDLDNPKYRFKLVKNALLIYANISSTKIRERMRSSLAIDILVPTKVLNYIGNHKLYVKH